MLTSKESSEFKEFVENGTMRNLEDPAKADVNE
jgi:hypothetical protein